jgi:hypothetical protein
MLSMLVKTKKKKPIFIWSCVSNPYLSESPKCETDDEPRSVRTEKTRSVLNQQYVPVAPTQDATTANFRRSLVKVIGDFTRWRIAHRRALDRGRSAGHPACWFFQVEDNAVLICPLSGLRQTSLGWNTWACLHCLSSLVDHYRSRGGLGGETDVVCYVYGR